MVTACLISDKLSVSVGFEFEKAFPLRDFAFLTSRTLRFGLSSYRKGRKGYAKSRKGSNERHAT